MQPLVEEVAAVDVSKWVMGYEDLVLKKQIGSGQGGIVLLAYLNRESTSPTVVDYIGKQRALGSRSSYLLVAVKRFRGEKGRLVFSQYYGCRTVLWCDCVYGAACTYLLQVYVL